MPTLEAHNIEGVKDILFDIPNDTGGVLVFKGHNAAGKTTVIRIVQALVSRKGGLRSRDHAIKGTAELGGTKLSVASQNRFTGESEIPSIADRFDFNDLINPPLKQPEAREKARIKALLGLTNAKADVTLFYPLVGGRERFDKLVEPDEQKTDDVVELAGRIARAFHAAAKAAEGQAQHERGHAKGCKEASEGVDMTAPSEAAALSQAWEAAVDAHNKLLTKRQADVDAATATADAKVKLQAATEAYKGPSVEQASEELRAADSKMLSASADVDDVKKAIADLQSKLSKLETALKEATSERSAKFDAKQAADSHAATIASWKSQIDSAGKPTGPTNDELAAALKAREEARAAVETGALVRAAKDKLARATGHEKSAKEYEAEAERLREAARSVDHVLSTMIPPGPLRAEGGRLVLDTERGEGVPYEECSTGEQWTTALPYGVQAVGEGGIIPVPQDAWQHLDNENRALVAEECRKRKVWLITGEVADGDLRAEVYEPNQSAV